MNELGYGRIHIQGNHIPETTDETPIQRQSLFVFACAHGTFESKEMVYN